MLRTYKNLTITKEKESLVTFLEEPKNAKKLREYDIR